MFSIDLNVRLSWVGVVWEEFGYTSKVQLVTSKKYQNLRYRGTLIHYKLWGGGGDTMRMWPYTVVPLAM